MNRAASIAAWAFVVVAAVVVPLVTVPWPIARGNPLIAFYAAKLIFAWVAIIFGWCALLLHCRRDSLAAIARSVFMRGISSWVSVAMLLIMVSAAAAPVGAWNSWFGTPLRMDGAFVVLSLLHLLQLAYALVRHGFVKAQPVTIATIGGASLVALILIVETFVGSPAWPLPGVTANQISVSTVGNIGALTVFLAVAFVLAVTSTARLAGWSLVVVWGMAVVLAVGVSIPLGRAGTLGALMALLATALLMAFRKLPRWHHPLIGSALIVVAVAFTTAINTASTWRAEMYSSIVPNASADVNVQHRLITWQLGALSMLAHPWLGTGTGSFMDEMWHFATPEQERVLIGAFVPDHLRSEANRVGRVVVAYDKEADHVTILDLYYDKAHNYFIDIGIAYGIPAMVALLLVWLLLLRAGWQRMVEHPALFAGVVAYVVAAQFWFLNINVDPALYVAFAAMAAAPVTEISSQDQRASGISHEEPIAA